MKYSILHKFRHKIIFEPKFHIDSQVCIASARWPFICSTIFPSCIHYQVWRVISDTQNIMSVIWISIAVILIFSFFCKNSSDINSLNMCYLLFRCFITIKCFWECEISLNWIIEQQSMIAHKMTDCILIVTVISSVYSFFSRWAYLPAIINNLMLLANIVIVEICSVTHHRFEQNSFLIISWADSMIESNSVICLVP